MGVLLGVVLRRYIILLIPTPLVSVLFAAASLLFCCSFKKNVFRSCYIIGLLAIIVLMGLLTLKNICH